MANISFWQSWAHFSRYLFLQTVFFCLLEIRWMATMPALLPMLSSLLPLLLKATNCILTISDMSHFKGGKHRCIWGVLKSKQMKQMNISIKSWKALVTWTMHAPNATFKKQRKIQALHRFSNPALYNSL